MKKLDGKPFVIVGVNSDTNRDEVKMLIAKKGPSWRSFWDGGSTDGPIQKQWNIGAYPTYYLIDHRGIILGVVYPIGSGLAEIEHAVMRAESAQTSRK